VSGAARAHPAAGAGEPADAGAAGPSCAGSTDPVRCTWCDSEDVEQIAEWGPQLLASQYMCRGCGSPFEWIKRR
jgi:hypothetical protein